MADERNMDRKASGNPDCEHQRILEGIVTTVNPDGSTNISPMGPIVDDAITKLTLRPFQTSTTYQNLKRTRQGVLHVTDDVELLARAAVGKVESPLLPASGGVASGDRASGDVAGGTASLNTEPLDTAAMGDRRILSSACRWYAFDVTELHDCDERTTIQCTVVDQGRLRDFFGFNRAKHAVVEAAILATRVGIIEDQTIRREMNSLQILVQKTGGAPEHRAFNFLRSYVADRIGTE